MKAGGPARSLTNLVNAVLDDFRIDVDTPDRDLGDVEPFSGLSGKTERFGSTTVYYLDLRSLSQVLSLVKRLSANRYEFILLNSVWDQRLALPPGILKLLGVFKGPLILMPRGELEPGALGLKPRRKKIAGPVYRGIYRRAVSLWGATSEDEAENIRSWLGTEARVVTTRNNGSDSIPWGSPEAQSEYLRVLFLSRIHPKKGLLSLLYGLEHTTRQIALTIAGPVADSDYWQRCQNAIERLPPVESPIVV